MTKDENKSECLNDEGVRGHEDVVAHLVGSGIPVMGHLGLTPQSVHQFGGYRLQGRSTADAERLCDDARRLEELGAFAVVLECVPAELATRVTAERSIPMSSHLFPEASAHLLAVTPTCHYLEYVDWASAILAEPLRIVAGEAVIPDRPGTGVAWDEKAVRRYEMA